MTTHVLVLDAFILCCQCELNTKTTTICATASTEQSSQIHTNIQQNRSQQYSYTFKRQEAYTE